MMLFVCTIGSCVLGKCREFMGPECMNLLQTVLGTVLGTDPVRFRKTQAKDDGALALDGFTKRVNKQ